VYGVDVDDYYDSQSSVRALPSVSVPLLCLNARDDPLIDPQLVHTGAKMRPCSARP
jgi:predicted alpha/beta-fold hydrolase